MYRSDEIRKKYYDFWISTPRDHKPIPNVSLVPNIDSTLLFVNSGMFPLASYLSGEKHPLGSRLFNFQRCLRPKYEEVLEVGDNRHCIMFEMMGNWSLGDFDKTMQIPWIMELYVKHLGFDPYKLYVSVWAGDEKIPRDDVAIETWKKTFKEYGIYTEFSEDIYNVPLDCNDHEHKYRIFPYGKGKNWWQRGEAVNELGGPSSEVFFDLGVVEDKSIKYHINDDSGRFVEIGNNVFMEYQLNQNLEWEPLKQKNIDFGGGFERAVMCLSNKTDIFETDLFESYIKEIENISGKKYKTDGKNNNDTSAFRVIADHIRAASFIIADGIIPSNKDQGYILRRFIRRMIRFGKKLGIEDNFTSRLSEKVILRMKEAYPNLLENKDDILSLLTQEEEKFRKTLSNGLKEIEKLKNSGFKLTGEKAFNIYETYGYPIEMTIEEYELNSTESDIVLKDFGINQNKHKLASKEGAEQKFKGGLADQSKEVVKLHTLHHLLLSALKKHVSKDIKQRGSNITGERLRLDFNYKEKLSVELIHKLEEEVNSLIERGLEVKRLDLPKHDAEKLGAEMEFGQKYPDMVSVYVITDENNEYISKEFCAGPHVKNTKEIGENKKRFKIIEEKNIGGGLRRIKAKLI